MTGIKLENQSRTILEAGYNTGYSDFDDVDTLKTRYKLWSDNFIRKVGTKMSISIDLRVSTRPLKAVNFNYL